MTASACGWPPEGSTRASSSGPATVRILFEDQIRAGDVVKVADIGGQVEDITLRHIRLRDYDGNVHFVPNSLVTTVTKSRHYAQAVIDVGVAYRENVDDVFTLMRQVGAQMRADDSFGPRIIDDLEIAGVERLDDSAVVLRCRFKVAPLEQWSVRRAFLRRLKAAFDEYGVEIPFPHLTVYAGADKHGEAPALPLRLARVHEPAAGTTVKDGVHSGGPPRSSTSAMSTTATAQRPSSRSTTGGN